MGAVTSAAASRVRQACAPRSIAAVTWAAVATEGRPAWFKRPVASPESSPESSPVSMMASPSPGISTPQRAAASRNSSVLPIKCKGRPAIRPASAAQALTAISGPMPDGSPWLMTMGSLERAPSSCFDNGVPPQIAQIAFRENGHLLHEELLLELFVRGQFESHQFRRRGIAAHDDLEPGRREERFDDLAGSGLGQSVAQIGVEILGHDLAEHRIDRALQLIGDIGKIGAGAHLALHIGRQKHGALLEHS